MESRFPVRQNFARGTFIFAFFWFSVLVRAWYTLPEGSVGPAGYGFGAFAFSYIVLGIYYGWIYKQPTEKKE